MKIQQMEINTTFRRFVFFHLMQYNIGITRARSMSAIGNKPKSITSTILYVFYFILHNGIIN